MLHGKHVLLGVTASIAAYKTAALVRLLVKAGAEVKVVMTPSAKDFVTPLTLSTVSKNPVLSEYFDGQTGEWNSHIELAEWADLILFAPLSANTLAKMAQGLCDNLLLAVYLSARCPIFFAPAMDLEMYQQESVKEHIRTLQSRGHYLIPAASGELASGLKGQGRMEEPEKIVQILDDWEGQKDDLSGKKVLVTAGPTREAFDPVRYISNHSSGKMGVAIAIEAKRRGAEVTLVHGPLSVGIPDNINTVGIESAEDLFKACAEIAPHMDITIMSAAVADYAPKIKADQKVKKKGDEMVLELVKTKDVLKELGKQKKKGQLLVGFALETNNEEENALKKLEEKNLDAIVLNSLRDEGAGFSTDTNKISILAKDKKRLDFPLRSKDDVARDILNFITKELI